MNEPIKKAHPSEVLVGIFVGGASSRMGRAKGLLPSPRSKQGSSAEAARSETQSTLLDELWELCVNELGCETMLVGERSEYAFLNLPTLRDVVQGAGPLSGLVALLDQGFLQGKKYVVALACDLPYVERALLERLLSFETQQAAVCAHIDGKYQPFFARYAVSQRAVWRAALQNGRYSLQPLFQHLDAAILPVLPHEQLQLVDWDSPEDVNYER